MPSRALATILAALAVAALPLPASLAHGMLVPEPAPLVYADGEFVLDAPIHVPPGGTMIVRNATLFLDYRCERPCETPQIILEAATLELVDARIETHEPTGWRIVGEHSRLLATRSTFVGYDAIHLQLDGPRSLVEHSRFERSSGTLTFSRGATFDVRDTVFQDLAAGIVVRDAVGTIERNHFQRAGTMGRAIDVQVTVVGEKSWDTRVRVAHNVIEDASMGVLRLSGFDDEIVGNTFRNLTLALLVSVPFDREFLHHDAPRIEGNTFEGNRIAFSGALGGSHTSVVGVTITAHGNSFLGTKCVDVIANEHWGAPILVDATGNWWGSPLGPLDRSAECPALQGPVLVDPWLADAP